MIKKIGLVVALAAIGIAIAMYLRGGSVPEKTEQAFTPRTGASESERISDLEKMLAAQVDRGNLLESRLSELEARLGARNSARRNADAGTDNQDPRARFQDLRQQFTDANGNFDPKKMAEFRRKQELDRLVQAGFTQERAEWIERRTQELQLQAQQAQYDAQRNGQPVRGTDIESTLRKEMGDSEYEKYLSATGRPTEVQVMDVLASSAAERAGLKPGDQIVAYAGQRVFDAGDLNSLTRQGTPGETVTVEVKRDGQTVQLSVPRGVLGVESGGGGRRGGGPGGFPGGPGGFVGGGPPGGFGGRPGGGG
jgi:hypothetical protein